MRRKSPPATIDTLCVLRVFRVYLSALMIDDDEMQTCCLEEARELMHPRKSRAAFCSGDDLVWYAGAYRKFALTKVSDRTCGPNISICRKIVHK